MVAVVSGTLRVPSADVAALVGRQLTLVSEMQALAADLRADGRSDLAARVQRLLDEARA